MKPGPRMTLRDRHGFWCARCLEYFPDKKFEKHHAAPKARIRALFAPTNPLNRWTVPVCPNDGDKRCHESLQAPADGALEILGRALARLSRDNAEVIDELFRFTHSSGLPALAAIVQLKLLAEHTELRSEEWYRRYSALNLALSDANMARMPAHYRKSIPAPEIELLRREAKVDTLLSLANYEVCHERPQDAGDLVEIVESLRYKLSDESRSSLLRRRALIERSPNSWREALASSRGLVFSEKTALVTAVSVELERNNESKARWLLEQLQDRNQRSNAEWYHKAEALFLSGIMAFRESKTEEAYMLLMKAQYIFAMCGIAFAPDFRRQIVGKPGLPEWVEPADVAMLVDLKKETCEALRKQAISDSLALPLAKCMLDFSSKVAAVVCPEGS
jgi:hypothetical protein